MENYNEILSIIKLEIERFLLDKLFILPSESLVLNSDYSFLTLSITFKALKYSYALNVYDNLDITIFSTKYYKTYKIENTGLTIENASNIVNEVLNKYIES